MILLFLKKYWHISLIAVMFAAIVFQKQQLNSCRASRETLSNQISQLEIQHRELQSRSIKAREQAELTVKSSKKDVHRIMSTSVPNDCLKSIQWGIQQANIIG